MPKLNGVGASRRFNKFKSRTQCRLYASTYSFVGTNIQNKNEPPNNKNEIEEYITTKREKNTCRPELLQTNVMKNNKFQFLQSIVHVVHEVSSFSLLLFQFILKRKYYRFHGSCIQCTLYTLAAFHIRLIFGIYVFFGGFSSSFIAHHNELQLSAINTVHWVLWFTAT